MSATGQPRASFGEDGVHSRAYIKKSANRQRLYKQSFGDFPDEHVYRDPLGFTTGGKPVTFQKDWGERLENEPVDWGHTMPGANSASVIRSGTNSSARASASSRPAT